MKRRLIVLLVFLSLALPGLAAFGPPYQDAPELNLAAQAGYNGYFRYGQWTPIQVTVSNSGGNLNGTVRVRVGGMSGLADTTYRTPLDLPQGSRKQIFLYVSLEGYTQQLQVEVTDDDGDLIEQTTVEIRMVNRGDMIYAVVTDSPYGAIDLTARTPGTTNAYQANWQIEDIPPLADALAGLDVLMFHDVNTATLGAEQIAALESWVLAGGHLIVTGGDPWQRTTAGLVDLLPAALQGTVPVESLGPLAGYLGTASDDLDLETTLTRATPAEAAQALVMVDDLPLVVRGSYGAGSVDFVAVDPNAEPLRSWDAQEQLWYTLISSVGQQPSWLRGFSSWPIAQQATLTFNNTALPTFLQMCGFLAVYIVLVGPLNYLVLKRLNRREWAWVSIPLLIVVFSVLAYVVGFNLRGNMPIVNRLSVVQVWPESEQAQVWSLVGVQSPRRSTYDVAAQRGYTLRTLPDVGTGLDVTTVISEGTRYVAESIPIDAGMVASFTANGTVPAPQLDAAAVWHLRADHQPRVEGSVTNTLDVPLEDAVVLVKGESRLLGTLNPGETRSFEITLGPQDTAPLTLGNALNWYNYYGSPWQFTGAPGWCFSPEGLSLTISDVMRGEDFSCSMTGIDPREQEIRRRYRLLGALVVDTEVSGGRGTGVYIFGWTRQPMHAIELVGKPQTEEDTTLYIFDLPVTVRADDAVISVPPGMTTWTVADTDNPNTQLEATPISLRFNGRSHAAFLFQPMPPVRLASVDELVIKFRGFGSLQFELWNWQRQEWVPVMLSPDSDTTHVDEPGALIGPENAVQLRITTQDPAAYNQVDYVQVGYLGRLDSHEGSG